MGLGGISIWQLLIILLIVVLLFGTKRLKSLGSDLGDAIKGFKRSVNSEGGDDKAEPKSLEEQQTQAGETGVKPAEKADSKTDSK